MQGRVGNITVLFSHRVKKKATLEEIRTSSRDIVSIEFRCHAKFNVLEKTRRNFFLIEKRSSEEEMQTIKNLCVCVFCVFDMQEK